MKPVWQAVAWTGGVLGAAATGAAVGVAAYSSRNKRTNDPYAEEPIGELEPDRRSTVAADDGVPLAVQEITPADGGEAELTVILVHGYALDSRCWHFQRRDLPLLTDPRVRVVQYDQRSHGRSGRSSRGNSTIEQVGKDLDAVIRATARQGPVVLVGHSMGGMTIMALAEQRPELFRDRVRAVALVNTSAGEIAAEGLSKRWLSPRNPITNGIGLVAGWQPALVERVRHTGGRLTWNIVRTLSFGNRSVSPSMVNLVDEMLAGTTVDVVFDFVETLSSHDRKAALAGLRHCDVLVIGGQADRVIPFEHSEVISSELPEAELVRLESAGHLAILEQHEHVTEQLSALIRRAATRPDTGEVGS